MEILQSLAPVLDRLEFELLGKLLLASVLGGVVGWERELSDKPAGLRTNLLICVGAALLGHVSLHYATMTYGGLWIRADPSRIAAQIVSGIGFLGAGTIIQSRGSVTGLTTAATLWVVAAIGIAVGGGAWVAAVGSTLLVLLALVPLSRLEVAVDRRRRRGRTFRVVTGWSEGVVEELEHALGELDLDVHVERMQKDLEAQRLVLFIRVTGRESDLRAVRRRLLDREDVRTLDDLRDLPPS